jgi:uncharacterized protein YigE (DUF2233 family)
MRDERMRFLILSLCTLFLTNCYQATHPVETPPHKPKAADIEKPAAILSTPLAPLAAPRFASLETAGITFEGIAFDSRSARLVVEDQANGPGSQFTDAAVAAAARNGIAAINAGFFTPEGAPLGLVVASGKVAGTWNISSSLGSGVWLENSSGSTSIVRRENLGRSRASAARELIQAGPLLIENNNPVCGLEATKSSVRSIIISDGATRWWIGRSSPCTLAALSQALSAAQPAGWPVRQALNLDGGRSSDLWISASVSGGPVTRRAPWNRPVRNFLVLTPR